MRTTILVSAITLLLHAVSAQGIFGLQCSSSDSCADGTKCVDHRCTDCTCDPLSCYRSVEVCDSLKCAEDEGCYLKKVADFTTNTVTVAAQCGKRNPCSPDTCGKDETCFPQYCGLQPPTAKCEPNIFEDKCSGVTCPENHSCIVNFAHCYGVPCKQQPVCADLSSCKDCTYSQTCEMESEAKGDSKIPLFKGKCVTHNANIQPFTTYLSGRPVINN